MLTVWLCFESSGNWKTGKFLVLKFGWLFKWKLLISTFFATACYELIAYKVVLTLESKDEILKFGHSNKSYGAAVSCSAFFFVLRKVVLWTWLLPDVWPSFSSALNTFSVHHGDSRIRIFFCFTLFTWILFTKRRKNRSCGCNCRVTLVIYHLQSFRLESNGAQLFGSF